MRAHELLIERRLPEISDEERLALIHFLMDWLGGSYMGRIKSDPLPMWERIHELFPPRLNKPIRLMRLVTLPIKYASETVFDLPRPAPKAVGSWTSTHFGLDSVHGIATEFNDGPKTCRIAIAAIIEPQNVLASFQSLKRAFLTLTHDYEYEENYPEKKTVNGMTHYGRVEYKPFLGDNADNELFHHDLSYFLSIFADMKGGPLRQYEYIVRTTPLTVRKIRVYRKGEEMLEYGHDDPHNSGDYRGYARD